jgi:hypothetical protein
VPLTKWFSAGFVSLQQPVRRPIAGGPIRTAVIR